jgi:DNA end-binding protein Ku
MHFADEVRDPHREIGNLPESGTTVSDRELTMAEQLIDMLAVDWNPDDYKDTFEEKVHELIAAKQAGQEFEAPSAAPRPSNVIDLMDVLSRSLESAGRPAGADADAGGEAEAEADGGAGDEGRAGDEGAGKPRKRASAGRKKAAAEDLSELTKAELYRRASELDIPHRSTMTRDELQAALEQAAVPARHLRAAS